MNYRLNRPSDSYSSLQWTPNNPVVVQIQRSSSEFLLLEGQTQERHPSYKESAKRRIVPSSTGKAWGERRYVVRYVVRSLRLPVSLISLPNRLNLTRLWRLVKLVIVHLFSCFKHRDSEASTISTTNSCSPIITVTFFTILGELSRVAEKNSRFCKNSFDASVEKGNCKTNCMRYGLDYHLFTISTTTECYMFRYCVPMDNQRPQLDLKFYKDICPDGNGMPLRTFMTVSNASLWSSRYRSVHQIWPILAQCRNGRAWLPKAIPTWQCI